MPEQALDVAITNGLLPRDLPFAKQRALAALEQPWSRDDAAAGIRQHLQAAYAKDGGIDEPTRQRLETAIATVTDIWRRNNWPERKLGWNAYPDLATHYGCFRCHDGQHRSPAGRAVFGRRATPMVSRFAMARATAVTLCSAKTKRIRRYSMRSG